MSYRNKTYIAFDADTDISWYRLMTAWKVKKAIEFDFHDAHDLNNLTTKASDEQIYKKLRERMANSKQLIVLVGENTKNLHKFVRWEIEIAIKMELPIIAVNLDGADGSTSKTPPILKNNAYFISVPFEAKKVRYALDNFPSGHAKRDKSLDPSSRKYNWSNITL
jgi:hypothetical protein